MTNKPALPIVGWREMVALPDLTEARIPAKIDTGARTSSLHALEIERFDRDGHRWVRFLLDIGEGRSEPVTVEAPRADKRIVTSSNGEAQERFIIRTTLELGELRFKAEFSLADRSDMKFPILIGRTALRRRFLVDSGRSYLQSSAAECQRILK
ncbi:ATP-dependent zinc protease family protein [Parerythrobacter aestuarii]|uniref:ATP-dependent zinc protease family protein n=1 Tax=Parerythrobacter aestuarii TaxID=3020909 RepID=UPI0024DE22EE|nr:RimK/LysX family protein [Parerythrobacter aestuarii]